MDNSGPKDGGDGDDMGGMVRTRIDSMNAPPFDPSQNNPFVENSNNKGGDDDGGFPSLSQL